MVAVASGWVAGLDAGRVVEVVRVEVDFVVLDVLGAVGLVLAVFEEFVAALVAGLAGAFVCAKVVVASPVVIKRSVKVFLMQVNERFNSIIS